MAYPITIIFTPGEFAILEDRLNLGDCIADALTDFEEGDKPTVTADRDTIEERASRITGPIVTLADELDLAILADAIHGSTIPYKAKDALELGGTEEESRWARAARRHFKAIEQKFTAATGEEAHFPKC